MSTQRSELKRIIDLSSKKWATGAATMLLGASLVLSACGDSSDPVVQSTPVATMASGEAAPADAEVEETAVPEEESATETESTVMTDTATLTDTEVTTEVVTDTIETQVITETEVITDTDVTTDTDVSTETETITDSEGMTDTEGVDDSDAVTDTEGVDDSETMTETGAADTGATDTASTAPMMGVSGVAPQQYVRASSLLDYDFENLNNEVSGDLEDLLIDLSTGRVLFASIEYGGVLDLGDKDIVVPLNAFTTGAEGELILNIDEAALETYPDVGNDWPDLNDPAWDDDVNTYWGETGIDVGPGFDEAATNVVWASELIGENVADLGVGAGSVLDILVNLGTGHANYVVVDYGEGLDTDPYIIPLSAFDVTMRDEGLTYGPDFTADILESAPRLDQETYPQGTAFDEGFGDGIESAWNDLGFSNDLNNDGQLD